MLTEHIELPSGAIYALTDYYNGSHWRVLVRVSPHIPYMWHSVTDGQQLTNDEASAIRAELQTRIQVLKALEA